MARTVGVEEEMLLVDVRNGRPRSVSGQLVLRAALNEQPVAGLGVRGALEGEFQQQMIETHTAPVESLDDLGVVLQVLARSATGQKLSVYTNVVSGPARPGEPDGPDEFHLVLLDNGRSAILGGQYAESLMCIRCGACLNACPVYQSIGGHAYGGVYSGPIGAILTPLLEPELRDVHYLPQASSL